MTGILGFAKHEEILSWMNVIVSLNLIVGDLDHSKNIDQEIKINLFIYADTSINFKTTNNFIAYNVK